MAPILNGLSPKRFLAESDASVTGRLVAAGFRMSNDELDQLRLQAALSLDADRILQTLSLSVIKRRLCVYY